MTAPREATAEELLLAAEKAQAAIDRLKAVRVAEGHTEAAQAMTQALAAATLQEKLERLHFTEEPAAPGHICVALVGEPGPATVRWHEMIEEMGRG